jgi:hypothetical protein
MTAVIRRRIGVMVAAHDHPSLHGSRDGGRSHDGQTVAGESLGVTPGPTGSAARKSLDAAVPT